MGRVPSPMCEIPETRPLCIKQGDLRSRPSSFVTVNGTCWRQLQEFIAAIAAEDEVQVVLPARTSPPRQQGWGCLGLAWSSRMEFLVV